MFIKQNNKIYKIEKEINKTDEVIAIDAKIAELTAQEKKEVNALKAVFKGERDKLTEQKNELNNLT